ncbi:nuclear pore complex protein Nup85-like [Amphiura filiformis]|uniref:nuclear pore complex protein Nup85-like n=1 Tax=Amphiura filiformis TaxID=82378 RepID=UPI003B215012
MAAYEDEIPFLNLPDVDAEVHGLLPEWGLGHTLLLHAGSGRKRTAEEGDQAIPLREPSRLHLVKWQTDMHNPITRKLVTQSRDVFIALQQHTPESADTTRKPQLVKFSRRYRAYIGECVQDLRRAAADPHLSPEKADTYAAQCELLQTIALIWSLCEILFVEILPGGIVLQQLLDWVKVHFTEGDQLAKEVLRAEEADYGENYWSAIYIYVLQGRLNEARHLLSLHPNRKQDTHNAYSQMDELLRRMPVFSAFSRQSLAEFELKWRHWQEQCKQSLEDRDFMSYPELETICKILSGDQEILLDLGELVGSWYQMMVTRLLYSNPTVKALDLQYHARTCMDSFSGPTTRLTALDSILLAAMEFDIYQVIKESSNNLSIWWFVAHLADLLHHCGQLDSHQLNYGSNLREFLILEYSSTLMSHDSMWQIVADYLDHCPQFGRHYLELYIERIPLQSERKAYKVLRLCEDRDMQEQIRSICKVLGMRALQDGRLGTALSWCIRSKDAAFATFLSDKFLKEYSVRGGFSNLDLIDNLGAAMLLSDRLTFLGKYREFHRLYQAGEMIVAADLILSLLTAKLAPRSFWLTLLADTLPLLELKEVIFTTQQTYELLHCLEELKQWRNTEEYKETEEKQKSKGQMEVEKEKLELLQLGLARNLARAIMQEGSLE